MPTCSPGWNFEPTCRTMIAPPVTVSPSNTFTPRYCGLESRPLRVEPCPFLCAMASSDRDVRDLEQRVRVAVAVPAAVPPGAHELEALQLLAERVLDDLRGDLRARDGGGADHELVAVDEQDAVERHRAADLGLHPVDEDPVP